MAHQDAGPTWGPPFPGAPAPPGTRRQTAASRLALVQFVAERIAGSRDLSEVVHAVVAGVREGLGASAVTIGVAENRQLTTLAMEGLEARSKDLLDMSIPIGSDSPADEVLRTGEGVFWSSIEERDRTWPSFAHFPSRHQAWAVLPLIVHGSPFGVMALGWRERRRFGRSDAAVLRLVGHLCAAALDRARLLEEERVEREILELLGEGTRLMVSALDPDQVVRSLVRLAVPRLAPWCAVHVAERDRLRRVAVEVTGPPLPLDGLRDTDDIATDDPDSPLAATYRTRETTILRQVDLERGRDGGVVGTTWTAMVVPVVAAGRVIGVMSLASGEWGGSPPTKVRFGAEGLAGRAGVALANARRFEHERRTAALLTQALLPGDVPAIPGYDISARYLPAGSQVAGDWFDVTHLPSHRFLVGIGDAAGHGIRAASLMAQLRNAARGLAVADHRPGAILHGLGLLALEDDPESFATAVYAVLDPAAGSLVWASAGHIPPLHCDRQGETAYLTESRGTPLGWPAATEPADHTLKLSPGEIFVLVTDGVVERRGADLTERLDQLLEVVSSSRGSTARAMADVVVRELCDAPQDDCCVVVLRRLPLDP